MIIKSGTTSVDYDEIMASDCEELIFEEPEGWVLTYFLQKYDYVMEYSQSTGRGEIAGTCIVSIGEGEVEMHFTANGKKNKKAVAAYKNEQPHHYGQAKRYHKLIKKQ